MFTDYEDLRLPVKAQNSKGSSKSMTASHTESCFVAAKPAPVWTPGGGGLLHVSESCPGEHSNAQRTASASDAKFSLGATARCDFT